MVLWRLLENTLIVFIDVDGTLESSWQKYSHWSKCQAAYSKRLSFETGIIFALNVYSNHKYLALGLSGNSLSVSGK